MKLDTHHTINTRLRKRFFRHHGKEGPIIKSFEGHTPATEAILAHKFWLFELIRFHIQTQFLGRKRQSQYEYINL